ncbi:DUF4178 domain-containing protein [Flavobacterium sp.]|uniref:DUF4178 domain-containing protein n=1 Tax=Flavobacterium sp. TaxID=239 RepID=UPI003D6BD55C
MKVPCFQCNVTTDLEINFEVKNFVCPNCQNLYIAAEDGLRSQRKFNYKEEHIGLQIGQKGNLKGEEYTVTGLLIKKTYGSYYWTEYILQGTSGNFIYLSEATGHWILLKDIEEKYDVKNHPKYIRHDDRVFDLYEYTDAEIVSAQGYFDFDIPSKKVSMFEYIAPPYILSIERLKDTENNFLGEHISVNEIKKAFPNTTLPRKYGTGLVEPFYLNVRNSAIVFCVIAILIFISHALIYSDQTKKVVLEKDFSFSEYNNKDFVSPSFTLEGGSAPMSIFVYTDTNNSWANVQIALVNETTNDEVYANKDVEFYHGYTEGENWTEGSNNEEFYLCGVKAGKYHLTITPQKPPEDLTNNNIRVSAVWNESSTWNAWIPVICMGLLMIVIYQLNKYFEQGRWAESDYSPFEEE